MTILKLTVMAANSLKEELWVQQLKTTLQMSSEIEISGYLNKPIFGQVVFIDDLMPEKEDILKKINREGRSLFLVVTEQSELPQLLSEGKVDDVIVEPFRKIEILGKFRHLENSSLWNQMIEFNASVGELAGRFKEDFQLVEKLTKMKVPRRFPDIQGFQVESRYLSGSRSGGDYFDLAESKDQSHLSMILSDSSSYGLSSAILTVLMKATVKLSRNQLDQPGMTFEVVRQIYEEIALTLRSQDKLSLFFGTLSRQDYVLRFLNLGSNQAFYAPPENLFGVLPTQGQVLTASSGFSANQEGQALLLPESRLVLASQGFVGAVGGDAQFLRLLNQFRGQEGNSFLNELVFRVKSKLTQSELPERDCAAMLFDVNSRILKFSKRES